MKSNLQAIKGNNCSTIYFLIPTLQGGGTEWVIVTLLRNLDRIKFKLVLAVNDMRGAVYADDEPSNN